MIKLFSTFFVPTRHPLKGCLFLIVGPFVGLRRAASPHRGLFGSGVPLGAIRPATTNYRCGASLTFLAFLAFFASPLVAGTPEPLASIERAVQDIQSKYKSSVVRVRLYSKAAPQQGGQGRPSDEITPTEAIGVPLGPSEVLILYTAARKDIQKIEAWWNGQWNPAVVLGDDRRLGFSVLKTQSPQNWTPVRWSFKSPEEGRWAVTAVNGGEAMNYRVIISPVWIWGVAKDLNGLGDILYLSMGPSSSGVLGSFDGEVLGLLNNGVARWVDEKFVKAIESAKGASIASEDQRTAWFGLSFLPLTTPYAEAKSIPTKKGVRIRGIVPGGPASTSGLKPNDIITKVNGKDLAQNGASAVQELMGAIQVKPKEMVKFGVWREGREMEISGVAAKPPSAKTAASQELGLTVSEILPSTAYLSQWPTEKGVIVTGVAGGGPASYARLSSRSSMILTEVAGVPIVQLADFYSALSKIRQNNREPIFVKGFKGFEYFVTVIDPAIGAKRTGGGDSSESGEEEGQP